jgi:hypothetical protein
VSPSRQTRSGTRDDVDLGDPEGLAESVVEVELLDVGTDLADVGEQPTELARLVGDEHAHRRVRRGGGTVLAGDARVARVARGDGVGQGSTCTGCVGRRR